MQRCIICGHKIADDEKICYVCKRKYAGIDYEVCGTCKYNEDLICNRLGIPVTNTDSACRRWTRVDEVVVNF